MDSAKKSSLTFSDFVHVCRLCLKFGHFQDYLGISGSILNMYNRVTNVPIKSSDLLPKGVCEECRQILENFYNFVENSKYNHFFLTAIAVQEEDKNMIVKTSKQRNLTSKAPNKGSRATKKSESDSDSENDDAHEIPTTSDFYDENEEIEESDIILKVEESGASAEIQESLKLEEFEAANNDHDFEDDKIEVEESVKSESEEENQIEEISEVVKTKKSKKLWGCKKCQRSFRTKNMLKNHISKHLGLKPFKCKLCNKQFTIKSSLKNHRLCFHTPKTYKCTICTWKGGTQIALSEHEQKHSSDHKPKIVLRDKKWKCLTCEKSFRKKNDLQRHLRIHTGIRPFGCEFCRQSFTQKSTLKCHMSAIHFKDENVNYECYICEKKFHRKDHIESHMVNCHVKKIRSSPVDDFDEDFFDEELKLNRDNSCNFCGKRFSMASYLRQHIVLHYDSIQKRKKLRKFSLKARKKPQSPNPCLCSVCGKSFEKYATFSQHMRRNHGNHGPKKPTKPKTQNRNKSQHPKFANQTCDPDNPNAPLDSKQFFDQNRISPPTYTDPNNPLGYPQNPDDYPEAKEVKTPRVHQCWLCGKIKSTHCNLKVHMRTHTGEKPYECKFCSRKFTAWNSWHDHENIHTGLKPYQCEICNKSFRQRSSLRKHLRSAVHSKDIVPYSDTGEAIG